MYLGFRFEGGIIISESVCVCVCGGRGGLFTDCLLKKGHSIQMLYTILLNKVCVCVCVGGGGGGGGGTTSAPILSKNFGTSCWGNSTIHRYRYNPDNRLTGKVATERLY